METSGFVAFLSAALLVVSWVDNTTDALILLAAVAAAFTTLVLAVRRIATWAGGVRDIVQDWKGEPERPGHDRVPGVMEQLAGFRDGQQEVKDRLDSVERIVTRNGGASLRDAIDRIEFLLAQHVDDYNGHKAEADAIVAAATVNTASLFAAVRTLGVDPGDPLPMFYRRATDPPPHTV
jgi:hypothetical protein